MGFCASGAYGIIIGFLFFTVLQFRLDPQTIWGLNFYNLSCTFVFHPIAIGSVPTKSRDSGRIAMEKTNLSSFIFYVY